MKVKSIFVLISLVVVAYGFTRLHVESPEDLLIGVWSERTWDYERVSGFGRSDSLSNSAFSQITQSYLGSGLLLHENEKWHFLPSGRLKIFSSDGGLTYYNWCLKGKGDVLVIKDLDHNVLEHYKVAQIDHDVLSLNFELDIQVKGLACLTFKKSHIK